MRFVATWKHMVAVVGCTLALSAASSAGAHEAAKPHRADKRQVAMMSEKTGSQQTTHNQQTKKNNARQASSRWIEAYWERQARDGH